MRYFKCLSPQSPPMMAAVKAVGKNGAWECLSAVAEALEQGVRILDAEMVSNWARVKIDRANRLLPTSQKLLAEHWKIYRKSQKISENVPEISENPPEMLENVGEISKNLLDLTPSNPHENDISITIEEVKVKEESEEKVHSHGAGVSIPFMDEAQKGIDYLAKKNMPNLMNLSGEVMPLARKMADLSKAHNLKPDVVLACWQEACDAGSRSNPSSINYILAILETKVRDWKPGTPVRASAKKTPLEVFTEAKAAGKRLSSNFYSDTFYEMDELELDVSTGVPMVMFPDGRQASWATFAIAAGAQ